MKINKTTIMGKFLITILVILGFWTLIRFIQPYINFNLTFACGWWSGVIFNYMMFKVGANKNKKSENERH